MSLSLLGTTGDFVQIGQPKWIPGGLVELDALELVYQGAYNKLSVFQNSLSKWMPSALDGNMYLESFPDDGNEVKPKVMLRFIGCKGGILPAVVVEQGSALSTVSTTDGELAVEALYRSPHTQMSWIGNSFAMTHSGFTNPAEPSIVTSRLNGHVPVEFRLRELAKYYEARYGATTEQIALIDTKIAALDPIIAVFKQRLLDYLSLVFPTEEQVTDFEAVPLVPDKFWACRSVTSKVFVPF